MAVSKYQLKPVGIGVAITFVLIVLVVGPVVAMNSSEDRVLEPFFAVSEELEAELEQIVMGDANVQKLVGDRAYVFELDDQHVVRDQGYTLAVGARFIKDVNGKQLRDWIDGGRRDLSLIDGFFGCLTLGYNEAYAMSINRSRGRVEDLSFMERRAVPIPELSREEKDAALEIAFVDSDIAELTGGKDYEIAPNGRIGVWHAPCEEGKAIEKMGVSFQIRFTQAYWIDHDCPSVVPSEQEDADSQSYVETVYHYSDDADSLNVLVDIEKGRVVSIHPSKTPQ